MKCITVNDNRSQCAGLLTITLSDKCLLSADGRKLEEGRQEDSAGLQAGTVRQGGQREAQRGLAVTH